MLRSLNFNLIVNLKQENLNRRMSHEACNPLLMKTGGSILERLSSIARSVHWDDLIP